MVSRGDIIRKVSRREGSYYEKVAAIFDCAIDEIKKALISGEGVYIKEFAKFEVNELPERLQRDPKTDEVRLFPATKRPNCRFSDKLKKAVKGDSDED